MHLNNSDPGVPLQRIEINSTHLQHQPKESQTSFPRMFSCRFLLLEGIPQRAEPVLADVVGVEVEAAQRAVPEDEPLSCVFKDWFEGGCRVDNLSEKEHQCPWGACGLFLPAGFTSSTSSLTSSAFFFPPFTTTAALAPFLAPALSSTTAAATAPFFAATAGTAAAFAPVANAAALVFVAGFVVSAFVGAGFIGFLVLGSIAGGAVGFVRFSVLGFLHVCCVSPFEYVGEEREWGD